MPSWRLKVVAERVLSHLPAGYKINQALQMVRYGLRVGTPGPTVDMRRRVPDVCRRLRHLAGFVPLEGATVCDVGTGFGLPAIMLYLAGAGTIHSFDVVRQVTFGYVRRLLRVVREEIAVAAEKSGVPAEVLDRRLAAIERATSLDDLFRRANILYQAPKDATATGLPSASIDLYHTFYVLEYVPLEILQALCREARRLLKPSGRFFAIMGCISDYARFDGRLHPFHYLSYSDEEWTRLAASGMKHLNRLREQEFIEAFQQQGATILDIDHYRRPEDVEHVRRMPLAAQLRPPCAGTKCRHADPDNTILRILIDDYNEKPP